MLHTTLPKDLCTSHKPDASVGEDTVGDAQRDPDA